MATEGSLLVVSFGVLSKAVLTGADGAGASKGKGAKAAAAAAATAAEADGDAAAAPPTTEKQLREVRVGCTSIACMHARMPCASPFEAPRAAACASFS